MISNEESLLKFALQASNQGRTVVFDLDNTLYPEDSFLELAYHNFSAEISVLFGLNHGVLHAYMMNCIQIGLRNSLLQKICAEFDLPFFFCKSRLFYFLRESPLQKKLLLFNWAKIFFEKSSTLGTCAIITNGNKLQQLNKIKHIHELDFFPKSQIIFASEHASKPAISSAIYLEKIMPCQSPVYIGDEESDAIFAKLAGWDFFPVSFSRN